MSSGAGMQSLKDAVASIRSVILNDSDSDDDIMFLENPESDSDGFTGPDCRTEKGSIHYRSSGSPVELQQRQISCSMELTESSAIAFQENSSINEGLVSHESASAASEEIKKLVNTALFPGEMQSSRSQTSPTLEEFAMSALKPQLSAWLNENLHGLVKGIVEKEISKIVKKSMAGALGKKSG